MRKDRGHGGSAGPAEATFLGSGSDGNLEEKLFGIFDYIFIYTVCICVHICMYIYIHQMRVYIYDYIIIYVYCYGVVQLLFALFSEYCGLASVLFDEKIKNGVGCLVYVFWQSMGMLQHHGDFRIKTFMGILGKLSHLVRFLMACRWFMRWDSCWKRSTKNDVLGLHENMGLDGK